MLRWSESSQEAAGSQVSAFHFKDMAHQIRPKTGASSPHAACGSLLEVGEPSAIFKERLVKDA